MVSTAPQDEILYVSFNQDQGCFACGTQKGFKIFNSYPFKDTFKRGRFIIFNIFKEFDGGIGICEMLFRCNILALVGGGQHPKFPLNKVLLWDDHQYKCIGELSFKSYVKAVRLRKDKVVVVLENRIYVYNFADLRLIDAIDTFENPRGLCAISADPNYSILANPDKKKGAIKITNYDKPNSNIIIDGHSNSLSCMNLNFTGSLLASASDKGTIIRIFSTETGDAI
jgi:WD40 repeat protein